MIYGSQQRPSKYSYVLATTENIVRWYQFDYPNGLAQGRFELNQELNLNTIPQFSDKETAKRAAIALGLKTWRYVRI